MQSKPLLLEHVNDHKADFRLLRLLQWAGFSLDDFERRTVGGREALNDLPPAVLVPMGFEVGTLFGFHNLVRADRGYVYPGPPGSYVLPTVHPGWIQRGNAKWSAAFIHDVQKAVELSRHGMPPVALDYVLDPSPLGAYRWAEGYLRALSLDPRLRLSFDIETPGKGDEEEDLEVGNDGPDRTWTIERIGFSYGPHQALSIPWDGPYMAAIRLLCESNGEKVVWNAGFDVPRIRRTGVRLNGTIHDGMVAWHILHSDLPKSLKFVATFTCPWQPAWKHLSGSKPAFYNATDADVEWRAMQRIEEQLKKADLWEVYQRDVIDLEPVLIHMQEKGMPVDLEVRTKNARILAEDQKKVKDQMESLIPLEARRIEHVYKTEPKDTGGLRSRPSEREVPVCSHCGLERPRKDHFKSFVKRSNPCAGAEVRRVVRAVQEYYRLAPFSPSRDQLIRYHEVKGRPLPRVYDRAKRAYKVSFAEGEMKKLILDYPDDPLYNLVLTYREIDKIAGTYVGRLEESIESQG